MTKFEAQDIVNAIKTQTREQKSLKESIKSIYKKKFNEDVDVDNVSDDEAPKSEKPASEAPKKDDNLVLTSSEKALIQRLRKGKEIGANEGNDAGDSTTETTERIKRRNEMIARRKRYENFRQQNSNTKLTAESVRRLSRMRKLSK